MKTAETLELVLGSKTNRIVQHTRGEAILRMKPHTGARISSNPKFEAHNTAINTAVGRNNARTRSIRQFKLEV